MSYNSDSEKEKIVTNFSSNLFKGSRSVHSFVKAEVEILEEAPQSGGELRPQSQTR